MVIDHVEEKSLDYGINGFAFIYFNYKDREREPIHSILSSLVVQLLYQISDVQILAERLFHDLDEGKKTPTIEQLFDLFTGVSQSNRIFLAFDALDEASLATRNALVSWLARLDTKNVLVLLTSRPDVELRSITTKTKVIDIAAQSPDLEIFTRAQLERSDDVQAILEDCAQDIVSEVVHDMLFHAAGM
jgi:hypothetical protein